MSKNQLDNSNVSIHLGKTSEYKSQYDSSLLVREPRQSNRTHLGLADDDLPFVGVDVWNAYEVSGLLTSGCPFAGVMKIIVPADSKYIVESKSLKLYLNSFNMTKLEGESYHEVTQNLEAKVRADLSELLETSVSCKLIIDYMYDQGSVCSYPHEFECLDDQIFEHYQITQYSEDPSLLDVIHTTTVDEMQVYSGLLKSNCRVTSQPDWGDVFITIKGKDLPTSHSLLKYIISFRDECHFHEEICETIYKRLWDLCKPLELKVKCLYARRGGIDINPIRCSHVHLLHDEGILNLNAPHIKTAKQ